MSATLALFGGAPSLSPVDHCNWPIVGEEEKRAVAAVLDRRILSGMFAPEAMALEHEFAALVGAKYCQLTHCGTSALQVALAAAGIGEGDEVIVPAYSFVATPLCVVHQGAVPLFVDVEFEGGAMDPAAIEAAISPRTRAVMPVHVHGCPADLDAIGDVAKRHDLRVIEDAAQAHGATYKGRPVGAIGASGGFSLQSSKNLCGGEGGLFVTNDEAMAEAAHRARCFGMDLGSADAEHFDPARPLDGHRALESVGIGWMYRGNEMMAAFVRAQLLRLPALTARCQENAAMLAAMLRSLPGVHPQVVPADRTSVHHKFRVRLEPEEAGLDIAPRALRDGMIRALRAEGVEAVLWQSAPLPAQPIFQRRQGFGRGFPWNPSDEERIAANYDPAAYPVTRRLLDSSLVLFSHSAPLIAQSADTVRRYGEAFQKVWERRADVVANLRPQAARAAGVSHTPRSG